MDGRLNNLESKITKEIRENESGEKEKEKKWSTTKEKKLLVV